jgi:parallel beta-helix repeat protein/predicted outer membrane repeat protein
MKRIIKQIIPWLIILAALITGCSPLLRETETALVPVSVRLNSPGEAEGGARTLMPGGAAGLYYSLRFNRGDTIKEETIDAGMSATVLLEPGEWTLQVYGYGSAPDRKAGPEQAALSGSETFTVVNGNPATVTVYLAAALDSTLSGAFNYSIVFPVAVTYGKLTLAPVSSGGVSQSRNLLVNANGNTVSSSGSDKTAVGSFTDLPAGYYQLGLELYDETTSQVARKSEIVHIYGGMISAATGADYSFGTAKFAAGAVKVAYTTDLPTTLAAILAGSAGEYVVELANDETCPPMSLSLTSGETKQFVITIRGTGSGQILDLAATGSLFAIGSSATVPWKITLILQNITLQGRMDNTASLVVIRQKGALILGADTLVSGNTSSSSGGGVSVSGGALTLSGGKISGNTAPTGGGVYHSGGAFVMDSGEISGNTASGNGGGIYSSGTFIMSGGKISGNETTGASGNGGGVYAAAAITLSGGEISGNTSASSGGGVYHSGGAFDMGSGALISGNTAASNGGGIYHAGSGAFTMNGGTISDNSAIGTIVFGGGVYSNGTFAITNGTISNNSAIGTVVFGGGVYVAFGGQFTMNGGTISGNDGTGTSGGCGGGVYSDGTFAMTNGTISGNKAIGTGTAGFADGGGVYINARFTMSGGTISGNKATGNSSSYGDGVHIDYKGATFVISGEARVDGDNRVCLDWVLLPDLYPSFIIGGAFTGPAGPIATIDLGGPANEWVGRYILKTDPEGGVIDQAVINRFPLGNAWGGALTNYYIGTDGKLAQK